MITASNFSAILPWVLTNGYLMIFIAIVVGGPVFISAAAFAAALGHLNIYLIFALAFFGNMAVNLFFYLIGYIGRASVEQRFGHLFGLTSAKILKLERLLFKHIWKTIFLIKYSPIIPIPGFVIIGAVRLRFKKFLSVLFFLSLPEAVFFTLIGYYFGRVYDSLAKYFYYGQYMMIGVIILFIAIYYLFARISKRIYQEEMDSK